MAQKNIFGAKIPTNASLKANAPVSVTAKAPTTLIKSSTKKASTGGSSRGQTPPFLSKEGQAQALKRVADVATFSYSGETLGIGTSDKPAGSLVSGALKAVTGASIIGSVAYGVASLPAISGATTATATGVSSSIPASTSMLKPLLFGAGGFALGNLFSSGQPAPMTQGTTAQQNTNTYQTTDSRQFIDSRQFSEVNQKFFIKDSPGASLYGTAVPTQTVSPVQAVSPIQDVAPVQDVAPSQAQNTGIDWLTLALIGAGAYLLLRK